jgi:glutathione synthase/RimK-type ligase-like ATP-grasp enzyme
MGATNLIVVNNPKDWPLHVPGVEVVPARSYLIDSRFNQMRGAKVFNLCKSYRYQSLGYYVSLLAAARGHRPLPSISTIQDLKSLTIIRYASEDLEEEIQKSLAPIHSDKFVLSIYFGRNMAKRYNRLSSQLFNSFQAPLLRAQFARTPAKWELQNVNPVPASEIPESHHPYVVEFAADFFAGARVSAPKPFVSRWDMAILFNPEERFPPSDEKAIQRFTRAAERLGIGIEVIQKDDYGRLAEFDALFIRETTQVNHHTYRFARRAVAEGLVVIDDPESILKCTNKVYLAELMTRYRIPIPKTLIVHRDNVDAVASEIGFPCILKQPDSSFSQGVVKVESEAELKEATSALLDKSDLVIAQEFVPTPFDWRIGVLDRKPIYACKYYMARRHWQIMKSQGEETDYGRVETFAVGQAPRRVVSTAVKAANLIGDGLYGVDLKQVDRQVYVIEINDNPSIEAGCEDDVLKDELYERVMEVFLDRIEERKERRTR